MNRRHVFAGFAVLGAALSIGGCASRVQARELLVRRDAGCGCCAIWTEQIAASGRFRATLVNVTNMAGLKQQLGVPADLASCHTATVDDYVIEGHVPAREIERLLRERPAGVIGLAVAGMPPGSPGMETSDGARDAFEVIAFGSRRQVFARYPASP